MIWYEDKKLTIEFDKEPRLAVSYPAPWYGKEENRAICDKPFINKEALNVKLTWLGEVFTFDIPAEYCWDGASIPRMFWRIIGSPQEPEFLVASMLHDTLCENHHYINGNRYLSTIVLERCLKVGGVCGFKRWSMKHSVDNFQKFQGWKN